MATTIRKVPITTPMYDDDGRLSRTWIKFFEEVPEGGLTEEEIAGFVEKKATFGIVRSLSTGEGDLTNHYISRTAGTFQEVMVNCKVPPTGSVARLNILKSSDEGAGWTSIFADEYIELEEGNSNLQEFSLVFLDPPANTILQNDLLRIDCVQAGATVAGREIEVVLRWE